MSKKRILTIALALVLAATIGFGSLAFFSAQASKTNTFYVASSTDPGPGPGEDPEEYYFSIALTETTGETYREAIPGKVFAKDPTVQNTGKFEQWVRVLITVSKAERLNQVTGNDIASMFTMDSGWSAPAVFSTGTDTVTYVVYLNSKLAVGASKEVFSAVTIPANAEVADMIAIDGFTVTVVAQAVQADNNGTSAQDAQGWPT